ncbi:hypothetical protein HZ326_16449 [Fusarium oxysporum f. sp. albedinis]|nr:hypothetical protein HZ326_16449 [Fusarium oxysporum f. sp. albedinis]
MSILGAGTSSSASRHPITTHVGRIDETSFIRSVIGGITNIPVPVLHSSAYLAGAPESHAGMVSCYLRERHPLSKG